MKSWLRDRHRAHIRPRAVQTALIWFALCLVLLCPGLAHAQSWQSNFTNFNATLPILLTDGTVICQDTQTSDWWKLTPDAFGSYVNGTWTQIASMPAGYGPLYYASAVLADTLDIALGTAPLLFSPLPLLANRAPVTYVPSSDILSRNYLRITALDAAAKRIEVEIIP